MKIETIKENGKTFEGSEPEFTRIHDEKWDGKHTRYTRCCICGKLCSTASKKMA